MILTKELTMMQLGESSILNITDEEFETYLKVLKAMQLDGTALFLCAESNLEANRMKGAAQRAKKNAQDCDEEFNSMAMISAAYYVRMKQRRAEKLSPLMEESIDNVGGAD